MRPSEPPPRTWFGLDEAVLLVALSLIVAGLWPAIGVRALTVPGLVLLWIALPPRQSFVVRTDPRDGSSTRKGT